ncbi:MAG: adenine phosphoribosyltransferase [Chloroflexi bacterium]|nr:adenine phosphoribosyltransferase [Chloroflexota bacterium]MDA1004769.1 adenine phosphoribosyltransferase [Chloroflexota bacterium]
MTLVVRPCLDAAPARGEHPAVFDEDRLRSLIRTIPDFPSPGVLFRDITPLLHDPAALRMTNDALAATARNLGATVVAGVEARGFIFGVPVAERLGAPFVPVRKPGKLPGERASVFYELEYGEGSLELHRDPSIAGQRVLIVDDLLATGGTAAAAVRLIEELGGTVAACAFVIELTALGGRARLATVPVHALLTY